METKLKDFNLNLLFSEKCEYAQLIFARIQEVVTAEMITETNGNYAFTDTYKLKRAIMPKTCKGRVKELFKYESEINQLEGLNKLEPNWVTRETLQSLVEQALEVSYDAIMEYIEIEPKTEEEIAVSLIQEFFDEYATGALIDFSDILQWLKLDKLTSFNAADMFEHQRRVNMYAGLWINNVMAIKYDTPERRGIYHMRTIGDNDADFFNSPENEIRGIYHCHSISQCGGEARTAWRKS